ncbi:MAG: thymidylate kinase [Planctomycetota bacterium]|nr:thymidylate kinase [Planctomycetota bacterium]
MATLIAIEGIDGAGKGTQAGRLVSSLRDTGLRVDTLQFPRYSATTFGSAIGDFLNGRFGSLSEVHPQLAAVLYAGDRYESRSLLMKMIEDNDVVVLDRFVGSNLAHQSAKLDGDERATLIEWIEKVEFEVFELPKPSLTILIDMSSQMSRELVSRKEARDYTDQKSDLQESDLPYLEKVRRCYLALSHSRLDWRTIHGLNDDGLLKSIDEVGDEIFAVVKSQLS